MAAVARSPPTQADKLSVAEAHRCRGWCAGIIDAERFKGKDELEKLEARIKGSLDEYVSYVRTEGLYGRGMPLIGTDVVEEICGLAERVFSEEITYGVSSSTHLPSPKP